MVDNSGELNQLGQAMRRFFDPGPTPIIWPRRRSAITPSPISVLSPTPSSMSPTMATATPSSVSSSITTTTTSGLGLVAATLATTQSVEPSGQLTGPATSAINAVVQIPQVDLVTIERPQNENWTLHHTAVASPPTRSLPMEPADLSGPQSTRINPVLRSPVTPLATRQTVSTGGPFGLSASDKLIPELPGTTDRQILFAGLLAGAFFLGASSLVSGDWLSTESNPKPVAAVGESSANPSASASKPAPVISAPVISAPVVAGATVNNPNAAGSSVQTGADNATAPVSSLPSGAVAGDGFLLPTIPIPPEVTGTIRAQADKPAPNIVFAPNQDRVVPTTVGAPLLTLDPESVDPLIFERTKPYN